MKEIDRLKFPFSSGFVRYRVGQKRNSKRGQSVLRVQTFASFQSFSSQKNKLKWFLNQRIAEEANYDHMLSAPEIRLR